MTGKQADRQTDRRPGRLTCVPHGWPCWRRGQPSGGTPHTPGCLPQLPQRVHFDSGRQRVVCEQLSPLCVSRRQLLGTSPGCLSQWLWSLQCALIGTGSSPSNLGGQPCVALLWYIRRQSISIISCIYVNTYNVHAKSLQCSYDYLLKFHLIVH